MSGFNPLADMVAKEVLVLCAHCDDAEIGAFGLLKKLQAQDNRVHVLVLASTSERKKEQEDSFAAWLSAGDTFSINGYEDNNFPYHAEAIKATIRKFAQELAPDLVLTHYRYDGHQDHRIISEQAYNIFRNHTIWEYEIPKYDVDTGQPNVFVRLEDEAIAQKAAHLMSHFTSQQTKPWYRADTFTSLARLRGVQCNSTYAEAFYCRKLLV